MKLHKWNDAYEECKNAIVVYPDVGMFLKLKTIAEELDKKHNRHWMARFNFPNDTKISQAPLNNAPWSYYRNAKAEVASDCSDDGIISGKSGSEKYLEVYSWTKMLKEEHLMLEVVLE